MPGLYSPKAILFPLWQTEILKKDGSVYEVGYLQLRMKKQPVT